MLKLKNLLFEIVDKKMYFLRDTENPEDDLKRNFSCNVNSWVNSKEEAVEYQSKHGALFDPKQDPKTKKWCADPEFGLSAFSFHDENSFNESLELIENYINHTDKIAVFISNNYHLGSGLDGEDTFIDGTFLGYLYAPYDFKNLKYLIKK
jgi:hypothetical protein